MTSKDSISPIFSPERLFPRVDDASRLLIAVEARDYSASAIARAVEDCDAHLLDLNLLAGDTDQGERVVALRIDHRNTSAVTRSLERYGYRVIATSGEGDDNTAPADPYTETTRDRVNEVLRYLSI